MDAPKVSGEQAVALLHAIGKTHRKFRNVLSRYADMDDFQQELACRILRRFDGAAMPDAIDNYAQIAATNLAAEVAKRQKRREEERQVSFVEVNDYTPRLTREPLDDLLDAERVALVTRGIAGLSPTHREAVDGFYFGKRCGPMSSMQKQRLHRARAAMAESIVNMIGA